MQDGYHLGEHRGKQCAILYVRGKRQSRISLGEITVEEAERRVREENAKWSQRGKPADLTVAGIFATYIEDRKRAKKAAIYRMEQCSALIRPHFGALYPHEITKKRCEDYIDHRRALAVGDATIRTELTYLAVALKFAVDTQMIKDRPRVWRPPQARPRSQQGKDFHLSRAQAKVLIDAAKDWLPHLWLWLVLALGTAGRPLHILQLEWDRVDFHRRDINLDDPKRDRMRKGRARVPMNQEVYDALIKAKRHAGKSGYVVEWNSGPVKSIKKSLAELCRRTGIKCSPYVLRHSAAVWMAEAGVADGGDRAVHGP